MNLRTAAPAAALALILSLTLGGCASDPGETPVEPPAPSAAASEPAGATMPAVVPSAAPAPITAKDAAAGEAYEYLGVTVSGGPEEAPAVDLAEDFAPVSELATGDVWVGKGDPVVPGAVLTVQYVGIGQQSRAEFDSSWSRGEPATFSLDQVIPGWQEGMLGMQPGGRRLLVIPGSMAYGEQGNPPVIMPDETLVFVVDLITATPPA